MDFRILGPLEVLERGQQVALGGAKQRALLTTLLMQANEVVSTDRLIDAVWEEEPPARADKALQVYVSHLRKALGRERLETKKPGYVLRVGDDELDLVRFERLLEEGRPKEALALWRGEPLADVAYSRFARAEIGRLEELRVSALEERIEQDLAAGRHTAVVGELEALVHEHPLRERLRGQLMLALYRSGRQAEALEVYQQGRGLLSEELGLEPSRRLRELQQAILNQDPALDTSPTEHESETAEETQTVSDAPARELRKTISVLHVHAWMSSANGGPLDPEALRLLVESFAGLVEQAAERHGGSVEIRAGDAATAVFGLPAAHEDDARRAVRAALDVRAGLHDHVPVGARVEVRMAIATGEVIAGGGRTIGEPLSAAARLAMSAESGSVLLDGTTHHLLRHVVTVEARGGALVLLDVREQPLARRSSPLVGRERELRRIRDVFEQATEDGACQMLTVLGSAGVGKSRLVDELLDDIQGAAAVTRGRCLPYGEGITFWPVMEAVKELVELDDADSPATARAKLGTALGDEQDAELVAQRVSEVIGLAEVALGGEEGFAAVRRLFETLARAEPIVVVFDDIHWGAPTFLDLIEHLSDWTRDAPILLICLARPDLLDLRPGWGGGKLNSTTILLEPLSEAESTKLVEELAGAELEESARVRIVEVAEGNPLFVEEMLALALDSEPDAELVVPPTIHALLAARLDRLGEPDRAAIELAAVQGKVFYEDGIAELSSDRLRPTVQSALASLVQKELVRPERASFGGNTFRFRHILIRDAAYEAIPKEARSELHEHYGRWLEEATGDRVTEYEEIVGYHFEQAYHYRAELGPLDDRGRDVAREAAERLGAAGRRAFVRNDSPAGVNLISRAVAVLPPDDPLRVELLPNVRGVQGVDIDMSWAERVLTEAIEAAATTGDRRLVAQALVQRGFLRLLTGVDVAPRELLGVAERASAVFEELSDDRGLAQSWRLAAQAHYLDRHLARCAEALERALAHARAAGDDLEVRESVEWLTIALVLGPTPAGIASERCRSLLAEVAGWPVLEAIVTSSLATLQAMQGDTIASEPLLGEMYRAWDEHDDPVWVLTFNFALTRIGAELSPEEFELLRRVNQELERMHKSHFSSQAVMLARLTYAQGHYEEAEALTAASERTAQANDVYSQIAWRSTRAKVLARKGELDEAVRLARDAVAIAERSDALIAHADAWLDLAEVLWLARQEGVADCVEEAIDLYEQKENVAAAGRARAWLRALPQQA